MSGHAVQLERDRLAVRLQELEVIERAARLEAGALEVRATLELERSPAIVCRGCGAILEHATAAVLHELEAHGGRATSWLQLEAGEGSHTLDTDTEAGR